MRCCCFLRCLLALLPTSNEELLVLHVQLRLLWRRLLHGHVVGWRWLDVPVEEKLQLLWVDANMLRQACHQHMPLYAQLSWPWACPSLRHGELLDIPRYALLFACSDVGTHVRDVLPCKRFSKDGYKGEATLVQAVRSIEDVGGEVALWATRTVSVSQQSSKADCSVSTTDRKQ